VALWLLLGSTAASAAGPPLALVDVTLVAGRWLAADELDGWLSELRHRVGPEPGP
jgi:hypothetical protein